jgi:hypothetical protein
LIGNNVDFLSEIKESLKKSFSMKDLGEAAYVLGIRIYRDISKRLIPLSQSTYIDKVLKRFNMENSKKGLLPMSPGTVLCKNQSPRTLDERVQMNDVPYASAVGSIMYSILCTRPDVSYALSVSSWYQSDPGLEHWAAVKGILKYLRRTKDLLLVYGGDEELIVSCYTDAGFMTDPDDFKSQSGYVFILNGGAVDWKSSKQKTVANMLRLQKPPKGRSGSSSFLKILVWSQVRRTRWRSIVIIVAPWLRQGNHVRTIRQCIFSANINSFDIMSKKV